MSETAVDSLCPYCGVGCQVRYHLRDGHILWAEGIDGPANRGQLCVKGRFGCDHAHHPDRLVTPLIRREDAPKTPAPKDPYKQFREASWEEALDRAASGLLAIRDRCGADALGAFGTAKGSNEDAYLLQKLVRTGFGTNSVDHCARLCHASSVVALMDQIGAGGVTAGFMQCNNADAMMIVGANPCQNHPVAAAFFKRAARSGTTLIVVDPRYSEIADHAHIAITPKPGSDIALFNAMAHVIVEEGLLDHEFVAQRTTGFEAFRRSLRDFTPEAASERCGVGAEDIREAARAFGRARAAMIFWGMGVTQHVHGVANVRTLVNLGLVTGNIGRPGTGLHPLRGQNNVQGVCDMGLLPNFLPGYARVEDAGGRERFENAWGCALPECAGLTIVEMVNGAAEGAIKGLYFMGENPAMSDPDAGQVRAALCRLEHLVVQDIFMTETAWYADVVLPAHSLFEKWGTFTNTNRQVQLARPVLKPPGKARADWWITQEIARRLGLDWRYRHPREVWEEVRALWPAVAGIPWSRLERTGWCQYPSRDDGEPGEDILFTNGFGTPDGHAKLVPVAPVSPSEPPDSGYPYVFITGRMLEHWHTGVLSRRSRVLDAIEPEPVVYLSGEAMTEIGASIGQSVRVTSRRGSVTAKARLDTGLQKGTVFMPFCFVEAAANLLTNAALDPQSKTPEYKYCAVCVEPALPSRRRRGDIDWPPHSRPRPRGSGPGPA
jgi:formate dehydrogenase major subunit